MDAQLSMDLDAIIAANKQAKRSIPRANNPRPNKGINSSSASSRSARDRPSRNGGPAGAGGALTSASASKRQQEQALAQTGANKITINNLHFGVTESDLQELFGRVGRIKKVQLFYDANGKSMGTAHLIFNNKEDAMAAIKKYNGVTLDGRPMQIEAVVPPSTLDAAAKAVLAASRNLPSKSGLGHVSNSRVGSSKVPRGARRSGAPGIGGRSGPRKPREAPKSQDDLDRELLEYMGHSAIPIAAAGAASELVAGDAMQTD